LPGCCSWPLRLTTIDLLEQALYCCIFETEIAEHLGYMPTVLKQGVEEMLSSDFSTLLHIGN